MLWAFGCAGTIQYVVEPQDCSKLRVYIDGATPCAWSGWYGHDRQHALNPSDLCNSVWVGANGPECSSCPFSHGPLPIPSTIGIRPSLGVGLATKEIHPGVVHELIRRFKGRHIRPHHWVHAVHLGLRAFVNGQHHFIHVLLLVGTLVLAIMLHVVWTVMMVIVVVSHVASNGWHEMRGMHAGRGLRERWRNIVQISSAQLGNHTVTTCCAYVDWCEGGDGLHGGGDLMTPVGGLVGKR